MKKLKVDIVSDVVCPWCALGFANFKKALAELEQEVKVDIHWRAFELNPYMGKSGQEINEHLMEKYGSTPEQLAENKAHLNKMGQQAGVEFNFSQRSRIYNTLDCHKLLHWAAELDAGENKAKQTALKEALFTAYFADGQDISQSAVLLDAVASVGLDATEAQKVLTAEESKTLVREEQAIYRNLGIQSVPAFIINEQYLVSGGQPVKAFKQALSEIASKN